MLRDVVNELRGELELPILPLPDLREIHYGAKDTLATLLPRFVSIFLHHCPILHGYIVILVIFMDAPILVLDQ